MHSGLYPVTLVSGVHLLTINCDAVTQMSICEDLFAVGNGQGCTTTSARRGVEGLEGRHRCSKPVSLAVYQIREVGGGMLTPDLLNKASKHCAIIRNSAVDERTQDWMSIG